MSFIIRNTTGGAIVLDDIGLTVAPLSDLDLASEQPNDIALSADLIASVTAGDIVVLDPLDTGGSPSLVLTPAQGAELVSVHNDPHYRIRGGTLNQLDDVDTTGSSPGDVLQLLGSPAVYTPVTPGTILGNAIVLDQLLDVNAPRGAGSPSNPGWTNGTTYVLQGNGSNEADLVPLFGGSPQTSLEFCEAVQDIAGNLVQGGSPKPHTDISVVYTDGAGQCDGIVAISVDDNFLRNTGDTLDSGTLTIATGADLVITDPPVNPTDATNKEYVDSVAAGLDPKESVRAATTVALGGTYTALSGGSPHVADTLTGVTAFIDGFQIDAVGDRVLVKDQADPLQNGIYEVTVVGAGSPLTIDLQRAPDQDGSPASEVSGGNFTFVENGTVNEGTGWVVQGDGILTLNTDDIDWVQFSEAGQVSAGIGLSQSGTVIDLDVDDLATATITPSDELAFHDADGTPGASGTITRKTTVADFINDLGLNQSTATASNGVEIVLVGSPQVQDFQLDINGLPADTITTADEVAFFDTSGSPQVNNKTTISNFLGDLNIVNNVSGTGVVVQTGGSPEYQSRSITVEGLGSPITGPLNGLTITNGDGIAGDPTLGLDINNMPARSDAVDLTDRVAVYNITTGVNEYYTISEITGAATASDSFSTWAASGNFTGSPATIVADSSADTANLVGGIGIQLGMDNGTDTVTYTFGNFGMADTPVVGGDTVPFFDASNGDEPEFRSFSDIIDDLDLVSATTDGILVRTTVGSPEVSTITGRSIDVDGVGLLDGLAVTNGDGAAGNPTLGLDIDGTPAAGEDLAASDELIIKNASAGTGSPLPGENQKITGQELADGVFTIQGLGGLNVTTIGGQEVLTLVDTTRANKILSIETSALTWSENTVGNNDWIQVGNATDADSGFVIPLDATIVKVVAHTENDNGNAKGIVLYIDGAVDSTIATFAGGGGEDEVIDNTVNIDVDAGEKLRLRGDTGTGTIADTVVTLWLKWRG